LACTPPTCGPPSPLRLPQLKPRFHLRVSPAPTRPLGSYHCSSRRLHAAAMLPPCCRRAAANLPDSRVPMPCSPSPCSHVRRVAPTRSMITYMFCPYCPTQPLHVPRQVLTLTPPHPWPSSTCALDVSQSLLSEPSPLQRETAQSHGALPTMVPTPSRRLRNPPACRRPPDYCKPATMPRPYHMHPCTVHAALRVSTSRRCLHPTHPYSSPSSATLVISRPLCPSQPIPCVTSAVPTCTHQSTSTPLHSH
jgi:hypothetical protein